LSTPIDWNAGDWEKNLDLYVLRWGPLTVATIIVFTAVINNTPNTESAVFWSRMSG